MSILSPNVFRALVNRVTVLVPIHLGGKLSLMYGLPLEIPYILANNLWNSKCGFIPGLLTISLDLLSIDPHSALASCPTLATCPIFFFLVLPPPPPPPPFFFFPFRRESIGYGELDELLVELHDYIF